MVRLFLFLFLFLLVLLANQKETERATPHDDDTVEDGVPLPRQLGEDCLERVCDGDQLIGAEGAGHAFHRPGFHTGHVPVYLLYTARVT